MPARSIKQRRMAGMALSKKESGGNGSSGMMGMSLDDLKEYAGTPEKNLPKRVRKGKKR